MGRQKRKKQRKRKDRVRSRRPPRKGILSKTKVDAFVKDGRYTFWLAHGANYLASPYEEGVWRPLFDLYEEERPKHYSSAEVAATARALFRVPDTDDIRLEGLPVVVWCQSSPEVAYSFYFMARQRVKPGVETREEAERVLVRPYVDPVWRLFDEYRLKSLRELQRG